MSTNTTDPIVINPVQYQRALESLDGYRRANQQQAEDMLTLRLKFVLAMRQMNKGQYNNALITLMQALEETKAVE